MGSVTGAAVVLALAATACCPASHRPPAASGSSPLARAAEHRSSLVAGAALGGKDLTVTVDDRPTSSPPHAPLELDVELGYLHALPRRLALGPMLRGGTFDGSSARVASERRYRLDLRLYSELSLPFATERDEKPELTLGLGFGPTVAWIRPGVRRVMVERYDTGLGLHAALRAGVRLRLSDWSVGYYAVEGAFHRVSADRTAFVRGVTPHVRERYQFDDYSFGATLGVALPL